MDKFRGFDEICKMLKTRTFVNHHFEPELLVPITKAPRVDSAKDKIADQDIYLPLAQENPALVTPPHTGCIKRISEAEKCMENALEIINPISKFCTLKSVMKFSTFLVVPFIIPGKLQLSLHFSGCKNC